MMRMDPPSVNLTPWWFEMERMIIANQIRAFDETILQMLFEDIEKQKKQYETDQIIARVMYKPCFTYNEEAERRTMTLRKKFVYLATYYFHRQEYTRFGLVVMTSIIREWPVPISSADDNGRLPFIWDRAPISIAMKETAIRKDGDKYVIRVLALEGKDIGVIIDRADVSTQLLSVNEHGKEGHTKASIIELNREGGERKREAPTAMGQVKKLRGARNTKNREEETLSPPPYSYFDHGFEYNVGPESSLIFVGRNGKTRSDYIAEGSNNVVFTINNISINDPSPRSSITQKYILKTHFEFHFLNREFQHRFIVKSNDYFQTEPCVYQIITKSMEFEASSNASTHWRKSFSAIWDTMFQYYHKMGQLEQIEIEKHGSNDEREKVLCWVRVKEMVRHFISCRSEFYVRPLVETELRTVSRMILARRLADYNAQFAKHQKKSGWVINNLSQKEMDMIQDKLLRKQITKVHVEKTFTQVLNNEMQSIEMHDRFLVKQSDFTDNILVLSGADPEEASCSIHSWLHAVSEIIAGPTLHFGCPKTTIRMFNQHLITLRSAESAKRTVQKILMKSRVKMETAEECSKSLMIRIDEREEYRLLFEMIDPNLSEPYHFGFYNTKAIKETKIDLNKHNVRRDHLDAAIKEGVIRVIKTKHELCGLFAVLKTGYLSRFHKIVKAAPGQVIIYPIFNSTEAKEPVYLYDFAPAEMVENEINPLIGPMDRSLPADIAIETLTMTDSMASMTIQATKVAKMQYQQNQEIQRQQRLRISQIEQSPFNVSLSPSPYQNSPHFNEPYPVSPMQPVVIQNQVVHHVHNHYGVTPPPNPPPYSTQYEQMMYASQGVQAAHRFTPPDPQSDLGSLLGVTNPNYQF